MSAVAHIKEYKTGKFYLDEFRGDISWNGYEHNVLLRNDGRNADGALRFTADAREAMVRRDIRTRQQNLSRALAIVSELQSTLDMDTGGEVAEHLDKLYGYVHDRLIDASIKQDVQPLDEARRVLTTLREGWIAIGRAKPNPTNPAR